MRCRLPHLALSKPLGNGNESKDSRNHNGEENHADSAKFQPHVMGAVGHRTNVLTVLRVCPAAECFSLVGTRLLARQNDGRATSDFAVGIGTLAPAPIFLLRLAEQDGRRAEQSHQDDHRQNAHGATFTLAGASVAQAGQDAVHMGKAGDDARHRIVGMNFVFEIHEAFVADCG